MAKITNVMPVLPTGVSVTDRTAEIEMFQRSKSKYKPFVETLKVIDASKAIQMDIKGQNKAHITAIKTGIRSAAKKMGFKFQIKMAEKEGILYIWSNR